MEVTNRGNILDVVDGAPAGLWKEVHNIVQESGIKIIPKKKKYKKAKWLSELQIALKRSERQRRKAKIYPFECRVPKKSQER